MPRAPGDRILADVQEAEHHRLLPLALGLAGSHLPHEQDPDKGSGPPAVIMPTLQTSPLGFRGVSAERA